MLRTVGVTLVGVVIGALVLPLQDVEAGIAQSVPEAFAEAYAEASGEAVAALYSKNAVVVSDVVGVLNGREAIAAAEGFLFASFCNPTWTATNVVRHGRELAIEYTLDVDFCGPFPGLDGALIQPTGERLSFELATFMTLNANDRVTHERRYANVLEMYAQLSQ
jgi:hypothetical protein